MRNLQTKDVFTVARLLGNAGIKEEFKAMADKVQSDGMNNPREVGMEFILGCVDRCSQKSVEKAVYGFLGDILEMNAEQVASMDLFDFMDLLGQYRDFVGKEKLDRFFSLVSSVMK